MINQSKAELYPVFATNVGSHMWGMELPTSDYDVVDIYTVSTIHLLDGRQYPRTLPQRFGVVYNGVENSDVTSQEIGHLIGKLIDGNVNAIWATMSPIIIREHPAHNMLCTIVEKNLARCSFQSLNGIINSHLKDATKFNDDYEKQQKILRSALRVAKFGITLFEHGRIEFKSCNYDVSPEEVTTHLTEMCNAHDSSNLPDRPNEAMYRKFLYEFRNNILTREHCVKLYPSTTR